MVHEVDALETLERSRVEFGRVLAGVSDGWSTVDADTDSQRRLLLATGRRP